MELWTIQNSSWRLAKERDIEFVDTSIKTAPDSLFCPSWDIVMQYKSGSMHWKEYEFKYKQILKESFKDRADEWEAFLRKDKVAIGCYCAVGKFCHRHLLGQYVARLCWSRDIKFIMKGELMKEPIA